MDEKTRELIEETVLGILMSSKMVEITVLHVCKAASEKLDLDLDLSESSRKKFVREVVESYLHGLQDVKTKREHRLGKEKEEVERDESRKKGDKEYDDDGGLIVCRLSETRKVTISEYKGTTLVSIREFYNKNGKENPLRKGISLTVEQWASFRKLVPEIENAIMKMQSVK